MNGGLVGEPARPAQPASRWGDLGRRAASALVLAPIALGCLWVGGPAFAALIVLAGFGLALEWASINGAPAWTTEAVLVPALVVLAAAVAVAGWVVLGLAVLGAGTAIVRAMSRRPLLAWGVLYIGLPLVALLWLRGQADGRESVLFLVIVIWASDIGAYMIGRTVGGPKLAPSLSPGKTWSGAVGGLAAVLLVAAAMPPHRFGAALLLGVVCQAGDLLESGIKRHVGVKDSGHLIPGHGGLLDRLDGLMAAAPVAALVVLAGPGG